jgi:hypothetical protein
MVMAAECEIGLRKRRKASLARRRAAALSWATRLLIGTWCGPPKAACGLCGTRAATSLWPAAKGWPSALRAIWRSGSTKRTGGRNGISGNPGYAPRMYDAELARLLLIIVAAMVVIAFVHWLWR